MTCPAASRRVPIGKSAFLGACGVGRQPAPTEGLRSKGVTSVGVSRQLQRG